MPHTTQRVIGLQVVLLALFLMQERCNPASAWAPWLQSLPTLESFSSTFRWSDTELDALDSSQLREVTTHASTHYEYQMCE